MTDAELHEALEALFIASERRIIAALQRAIESVVDRNELEEITLLLSQGRAQEVLQRIDLVDGALDAFLAPEIHATYLAAAALAVQAIRAQSGLIVGFDGVSIRAVSYLQDQSRRIARELRQDAQEVAREVILQGLVQGKNPRATARAFRDAIGLTVQQERYIENFRRALEAGDARALARELRDRRFDPSVRAAVAGQRILSPDQIDRQVGRYRQRWLAHRAEVIAQHESLQALNAGIDEAGLQFAGGGPFGPGELEQVWHTARDLRVRDSHRPMEGQTQLIGEPFISGAGIRLRFPGDPSAPASEVIGCRCTKTIRVRIVEH